jgi:hypothetical protein
VSDLDDDSRLRTESAEIERLLEELREQATPAVWLRVEQLLRRVMALHGAGLARALEHARGAGVIVEVFDERVTEDDLLGSLLALHGLHPRGPEERIRRALDALCLELGCGDGALELIAIEGGVARIRATAPIGGGAISARVAEGAIRRAIEGAAPEIETIELAGPPGARDPGLVQIRTARHAR